MTDFLLPDVEQLVSKYLRAHVRVESALGDRVFTVFPKQATYPLLLIQRIGGIPPLSHPLIVDEAQLQLDSYGGTKASAWTSLAVVLSALDELEGRVDSALGYVSAVRQGAIRYQPDDSFKSAKPRYIADVILTTRSLMPSDVPSEAREDDATVLAGSPTST
jgi:hypothetical protein